MLTSDIVRALRSHRIALALVLLLSLAAAIIAGYRVQPGLPPKLTPRSLPQGIATKQVLVDASGSAVTDLSPDMGPLVARSGTVADLLASTVVLRDVARRLKIPAEAVTAEGPWEGPAAIYNVVTPSAARGIQVLAETRPYRVVFVTRPTLPILTIRAQGPSPVAAAALADATFASLQSYVDRLAADITVKPLHPIVLRDLGPAAAGSVHGGVGKAVIVLAGAALFVLGLLAILSFHALVVRLKNPRPEPPPVADTLQPAT